MTVEPWMPTLPARPITKGIKSIIVNRLLDRFKNWDLYNTNNVDKLVKDILPKCKIPYQGIIFYPVLEIVKILPKTTCQKLTDLLGKNKKNII